MDLNTLLKHTSRSLYLSAKMLPPSVRPAFGLAYLLCRYADTIADTSVLPPDQRIYWIQQFPQIVQTQDTAKQDELVRALTGTSANPYETQLISHLDDCLQALNHISPQQKNFINGVVQAVCEGMKIDLMKFPHEKNAPIHAFMLDTDLTHYCRLMGGKPGHFWSQLIFHSQPVVEMKSTFYGWGEQIGDALQIVNILRDLPKDLQQGRCYFPQTDLERYGLKTTDLLKTENSSKFNAIKNKWITWGKQNLTVGVSYYAAIPKKAWRVRAAVAWPMLWTADTFIKLHKAPDLLDSKKRVKISRLRVYLTMLATPPVLLSNRLFEKWLSHKLKQLP